MNFILDFLMKHFAETFFFEEDLNWDLIMKLFNIRGEIKHLWWIKYHN